MRTELTPEESDALIEGLARWAVGLNAVDIVAFMLEVNRPLSTLSGNALIGLAPALGPVVPVPLHSAGLLLQEPDLVARFRAKADALRTDTATR